MNKLWNKYQAISEKSRIVLKNATDALIIKGAGLIVSLISMPVFIRFFDNNAVLGVWFTILSVITWIDFFDLGIGNGLRNSLVDSLAKNDDKHTKELVSSAYVMTGAITLLIAFAGLVLIPKIDWNSLFSISPDVVSPEILEKSIYFVLIGVAIHFFLKLISSIIYALQKAALNNLLSLISNVLRLLYVLIIPSRSAEANLLSLSKAYIVLACLPYLIATVVLFSKYIPAAKPNIKYVKRDAARNVIGVGLVFFVCQILYMLIINTNDLCITYFTGPENTTDYNIYFKLFSVVGTLSQLALAPVWSMVTKAASENDYGWLSKLYTKTLNLMAVVVLAQFTLVLLLQPIINIWLGDNAFRVNYIYALSFAIWGIVFTLQNALSTFVCGLGKLKLQTVCYSAGVAVKALILFIAYRYTDLWIIVLISNIIILLPYCILQHIQLKRMIGDYHGQSSLYEKIN